jgi:starch phosphorylase
MEIGLENGVATYSGGLGVLAGDTVRAAADLGVPMVAVTLLHRKGYFYQTLDASGWQREEPVAWPIDDYLAEQPQRASVTIEGRQVQLRAWKYEAKGIGGWVVPVYFLDADLPENSDYDRTLTDALYGGDKRYRLCQEAILGIGGVRMLKALGHASVGRYHMNEGHAALLTVELLEESARSAGRAGIGQEDVEAVRESCVFTTHTPVPAGHDQFPMDLVRSVLGHHPVLFDWQKVVCCEGLLNLTYLALNLSRYVNGVAKSHGEVSRLMFAKYQIDSITNGVHAATWACPSVRALLDRYIPDWRKDNFSLRYALNIPKHELWEAHLQAKRTLIQHVNRETNAGMDADVLTLGFARRAAAYKRADLLFDDIERLRAIANTHPLQIVYAGKAHPQDQEGKELIKRIVQARSALRGAVRVAYVPNYDIELGALMTSGVDVWLNTPQPPMEASGTSGMKAALNGVPSLSVLDGWWVEGCIEGVTGWAIGHKENPSQPVDRARDAAALYEKLQEVILPLFYENREAFGNIMLHCIGLNGSFFNTHRMMQQYVLKAYFK